MGRLVRLAGIAAAGAALGVVAERVLVASPRYRGAVSDHFDGRRFFNHQAGWQTEGSFLKWRLTRHAGVWRAWVDEPPGARPEAEVDGGRVRVTWVNHSTVLVQMDGLNVLTDPVWSERVSPGRFMGPRRRRGPGLRFEDLPRIDVVLVSHNHYDHMDVATLRRLGAPMLVPLGNSALLARHGIEGSRDLDWWEGVRVSDRVTVTAVPAQHFSARGLTDRNAALWCGFVIGGPSGHVYFAGDTGWGRQFEEIALRFGPMRVALLPIGAYEPRWITTPAHISPAEAVEAHLVLGARTSVGIHWGTFRLGDEGEVDPARDLAAAVAAKGGPDVRVVGHGVGVDL